MEGFQAVLGFVLGVVIFIAILSKLRVIFAGYYVLVFFFFISLCLGMILAKLLSWLVIILIVIGVAAFIYMKITSEPSEAANQDGATADEDAQSQGTSEEENAEMAANEPTAEEPGTDESAVAKPSEE